MRLAARPATFDTPDPGSDIGTNDKFIFPSSKLATRHWRITSISWLPFRYPKPVTLSVQAGAHLRHSSQ